MTIQRDDSLTPAGTAGAKLYSVSAVVPVHAGGRNFELVLDSLSALRPPCDEVIVVFDGASDGSLERARQSGFRVIALDTRGGPARARNAGAAAARGDVLFFVDADVTVPPDSISRIVEAFEAHPGLSALFGSYDDAPAAPNFLSQYKNLFHHYVHQHSREDAWTFWAGCGAILREVFLSSGGFDETYREPSVEDIELGYRLRAAGRNILLLKSLQAKHLKKWDAMGLLKSDFLARALPWTHLILTRGATASDLNLKWSDRASVVLALLLVLASIAGLWLSWSFYLAGGIVLALLALNAGLYRFFLSKRGALFALAAIGWHWFYFLYCGVAFAIVLARHVMGSGAKVTEGAAPVRLSCPINTDGEHP